MNRQRSHAETQVNGHHGGQLHAIDHDNVDQVQNSKAQHPTDVVDVVGGAGDEFSGAHLGQPAGLLSQQVIKELLPQTRLHGNAHPEHQEAGGHAHRRHDRGQAQQLDGPTGQLFHGEPWHQAVNGVLHQQGEHRADEVQHHQRHDSCRQLLPMGRKLTPQTPELHTDWGHGTVALWAA